MPSYTEKLPRMMDHMGMDCSTAPTAEQSEQIERERGNFRRRGVAQRKTKEKPGNTKPDPRTCTLSHLFLRHAIFAEEPHLHLQRLDALLFFS